MNTNKTMEYVKTQLEYDNKDDVISNNTKAMVKISHDMVVKTVKEFARKTNVNILDIGCGWGDFSNQLDPYIGDYIGVEPSMIELKRFLDNGKTHNRYLVRGFGEYLDFIADNSRNVILLNSVLDHCYDWKKTVHNCKRILAPNGLVIVAMENSKKIPIRLREFFGMNVIHHGHLSYLSGDDLEKLFSPEFRILEKKSTGFLFGFDSITKHIALPLKLMIVMNQITNILFQTIFPNSGHLLYYVFLNDNKENKNGVNNFINPFQCPKCYTHFKFGEKQCPSCRNGIFYLSGSVLNSFELPRLRDELPSISYREF